jgi:hypothetical protein
MAKRDEQFRAVGSHSKQAAGMNADQVGDESQATEIIELAIDDLRLITSAFEIIDLSFQQFPDKFIQATPAKLSLARQSEIDEEDSQAILH